MATFQAIVNAFLNTYEDCDLATATILLNDIDEEILNLIPYRKNTIYLPMVSNQAKYDADETVIKVWSVDLVNPDGTYQNIGQVSEVENDWTCPGWKGTSASSAPFVFDFTSSMTSGQYEFTPKPNYSNLVISAITNTSAPFVTTTVAHGLSNKQQIQIQNATGTTLAGSYYVFYTTTGFPATQFALFLDSALTIPAPASGVGTGGVIGTAGKPFVAFDVTQRSTLTSSSNMPLGPTIRRLYADGMRYLWALQKHWPDVPQIRAQFENDLAIAADMWFRRAGRVPLEIKPFKQDMGFRRGYSGWNYQDINPFN